ncbi:hypothetical protein D3C76_405650 [compost metagenome]
MRSALFELISDLNPQRSENEHAARSLLDSMFPNRVEARRWRHYRTRYQALLKLLEDDDFYRLFGETFQRAYEEEIRRCSAASLSRTEAQA